MEPRAAPDPAVTAAPAAAHRALRLAALGAAAAALGALGCPFAAVTHLPCPGCGLTRATTALLHGEVREALALHPLAPLVSPLLVGFCAYAAVVYARTGRWPGTTGRAGERVAAAVIALWTLLLAVWIARFSGAFGGPVPV